jgi:hypothetical protein
VPLQVGEARAQLRHKASREQGVVFEDQRGPVAPTHHLPVGLEVFQRERELSGQERPAPHAAEAGVAVVEEAEGRVQALILQVHRPDVAVLGDPGRGFGVPEALPRQLGLQVLSALGQRGVVQDVDVVHGQPSVRGRCRRLFGVQRGAGRAGAV